MINPADLSAREAAAAVRSGRLSAEALTEAYLDRVQAVEPSLRAFAYLEPDLARAQARAIDKAKKKGALAGVPVGVKDIIDTADMPTECNSAIRRGHRPSTDAACVEVVRKASGIVFGKTVTTEFAGRHPGPTGNPYDLGHSPGGSSSGSAAAVAAGILPLAFATQTAGSVIRPAAYCGCPGFKATRGALSLKGIQPLAADLDTLGFYARNVDDLLLFHAVLAGVKDTRPTIPRKPRIAVMRTMARVSLDAAAQEALDEAAAKLAPEATIERVELPSACDGAFAAQEILMAVGAARAFEKEWEKHRELMTVSFRDRIQTGLACSPALIAEAEATRAACIAAVDAFFKNYDAILTPAAPGEAPRGLSWTGDPEFNRLWTLADTPCASLPVRLGPNHLPLAVQLVAARGSDRTLLALADWAFAKLGKLPPPSLPKPAPLARMTRRAGLTLDAALTASTEEAERANRTALQRVPRDFSYADEPSHVFHPSRRN
ncbi:MAG: amidase [Alphaproteobacteria bacterium]|nr:amidase [Alphaproteobacteria bacterium]